MRHKTFPHKIFLPARFFPMPLLASVFLAFFLIPQPAAGLTAGPTPPPNAGAANTTGAADTANAALPVIFHMLEQKYVLVPAAMAALGFAPAPDIFDGYEKTLTTSAVTLIFAVTENRCLKNDYIFTLPDGDWRRIGGQLYVEAKKLAEITGHSFSLTGDDLTATPRAYATHEWLSLYPPLIAHGAGGIDAIACTNTLEALVANYNQGHRVFELDLYLTSDHNLVAAHDPIRTTAEKWQATKIRERYTPMTIDDILDQMLINRDMFFVTDTKSYDLPEEKLLEQFSLIRDKALARDPSLLERIIPQIYNESMYGQIARIHAWPSVIYTLYATNSPPKSVLAFVAGKEDIKAVTMPPERAKPAFVQQLNDSGKVVYIHTINTLEEVRAAAAAGVRGFYTDFLLPGIYVPGTANLLPPSGAAATASATAATISSVQ
ncbi:MAG: hypothetical protein LBK98_07845 [Peptococcaceae bacterium]|jgi:glycerophosphoryl diester phosphodiesterase|nr:hypothetical protein [Peptococcaceae bacterium]